MMIADIEKFIEVLLLGTCNIHIRKYLQL